MKKIVTGTLMLTMLFTTTQMKPEQVQAATIGINDKGELVTLSTGKIVKGYKVYKKRLYKDGLLAKGRVKYGTGDNLRLYHNGFLQSGLYFTKDNKYAFKNGSLIKGIYVRDGLYQKHMTYTDGRITSLIEMKDNKLYENGKLKKGDFVMVDDIGNEYDTVDDLFYFHNGVLAKDFGFAEFTGSNSTFKKGRYLFKNGRVVGVHLYKGLLYKDGVEAVDRLIRYDGKMYYNHKLANGIYDGKFYKDGIYVEKEGTKHFRENIKMMDTLAEQLPEHVADVAPKLVDLTIQQQKIVVGHELENYDLASYPAIISDLRHIQDVSKMVEQAGDSQSAQKMNGLVEETITTLYKWQQLLYADGKLVDGAYKGNFYEKGRLLSSIENKQLDDAIKSLSTTLTTPEEAANYQAQVMTIISRAQAVIEAANKPPYENVLYSTSDAKNAIHNAIEQRAILLTTLKKQQWTLDTMALDSQLRAALLAIDSDESIGELDEKADFMPLQINEVATGKFNADGFAYFEITVPDVEGNYKFVGNAAVTKYKLYMNPIKGNLKDMPVRAANKDMYVEKGHYYVAVKGKPMSDYRFKLKKHAYDLPAVLAPNDAFMSHKHRIDIPYYSYSIPSTKVKLTTNQHATFFANYTSQTDQHIQAVILTNDKTGKQYKSTYKGSGMKYGISAPNGTYTLTLDLAKKGVPGHVSIYYLLSDILPLNQTIALSHSDRKPYTLNTANDTKIKFSLTTKTQNNNVFRIYNDQNQLVKKITLTPERNTRDFVYTVKKGRYSVYGDNLTITTKILK